MDNKIIDSRKKLTKYSFENTDQVGEGGCGVIGFASTIPVKGKHLLTSLKQMTNRGNGKGGGIAMLGLNPDEFGVTQEVLDSHYLIVIAYLDMNVRKGLEAKYINDPYEVTHSGEFDEIGDFSTIGLDVNPPKCIYYFCRVKQNVLDEFKQANSMQRLEEKEIEDEYVYQNTYKINSKYYASLGEKEAFVLSHGQNLIVLKLVGYAQHVIEYYQLENIHAKIWIGHHRYPTKGAVWHPGGAHPFIGLNEALVHNGDFANYKSMQEYLEQKNIFPLFLTDTEVAVLQFDLYRRVYKYSMETLIEAIAPTTERDFLMLPDEKKKLYSKIQRSHLHASPDGPWFFIVAQNNQIDDSLDLIGITDTSMLRPQVFAIQQGEEAIGLIGSERQAIDAILRSISEDDSRFSSKADIYWNARGGSYNDGGAFSFSIINIEGQFSMVCKNKFGEIIENTEKKDDLHKLQRSKDILFSTDMIDNDMLAQLIDKFDTVYQFVDGIVSSEGISLETKFNYISSIFDKVHLLPYSKNGKLRSLLENSISKILRSFSLLSKNTSSKYQRVEFNSELREPKENEELIVDCAQFVSEGPESAAAFIVNAYNLGWSRIISFDWRGQRFCGSGLGSNSDRLRIDTYGNPGDYLGSGIDGAQIHVHGAAQDQVGQIMRRGKLVIYGDVGQTFMYGAKGGEAYILGNVAGRALINAGGTPKIVINGTALDYLAESFMAGDPLTEGGFIIVNGHSFSNEGTLEKLESPYPGGNLFSLASGGALYINDPKDQIDNDQLHGGAITSMILEDWYVMTKYLLRNMYYFGINIVSDNVLETFETRNGSSYLEIVDKYPELINFKKIVSMGKVRV